MESFLSLFSTLQGIVAIVVFFGGSIFVHELGHFLAARWRGIRVTRFSIGFGPRLFTWTSARSGIEYCVSLLPLGGYVAVPDLAEMSAIEGGDKINLQQLARCKTRAQITYLDRVIVLAAGAFFNVVFAVVLAFVAWAIPVDVPVNAETTVVGNVEKTLEIEPGVEVAGPAFAAGIKVFDKIIAVDGVPVNDFSEVATAIAFGTDHDEAGNPKAILTIENATGTHEVVVKPALVATNSRVGDRVRMLGLEQFLPARIVPAKNLPAEKAGLQAGDVITKVGDEKVGNVSHLSAILRSRDANTAVEITYERDGNAQRATIQPLAITRNADLLNLTFERDGNAQNLHILATPSDLENVSLSAPRETLRTFLTSSDEFPIGTIIDGVSIGGNAKIVPAKNLPEFAKMLAGTPTVKFFITYPNGESVAVAGTIKSVNFVAGTPEAFIGVGFAPAMTTKHVNASSLLWRSVDVTFKSLAGLVNPSSDISIKHMNGVFSIGEVYYRFSQSLYLLLSLTVMININLAILNLLPVPVLDGGHILIATINRLRKKAISIRTQSCITMFFMMLLFGFMGYVLLNDWSRLQGNQDAKQATQIEKFTLSNDYLKLMKK